jgi:lipopolysaccharide export system permease protein
MRLLDRYLLRELLVPLGYCLGGFLIFWISFDLFSNLSKFQEAKLTVPETIRFYGLRMPDLLVLVLPVALLLALLYAITNHARHHELIAIRAAGVNLWRLSAAYLGVGLAFAGILFWLNERWVPNANEATEQILNSHQTGNTNLLTYPWKSNVHFRNARDERIWNIAAYNLETGEMRDIHLESKGTNGASDLLIAKRAVRTNEVWTFFDVHTFHYTTGSGLDPEQLRTNELSRPDLSDSPSDIRVAIKFSKLNAIEASKRPQLALSEIQYLRAHLPLSQRDRFLLETQYQARLAMPWTCLVVVLIAIPFGAASGRRNVFVGVASSIFICFAFFILSRFGLALGTGGYVPSWIAAWGPNLFFGAVGAVLIQTAK